MTSYVWSLPRRRLYGADAGASLTCSFFRQLTDKNDSCFQRETLCLFCTHNQKTGEREKIALVDLNYILVECDGSFQRFYCHSLETIG